MEYATEITKKLGDVIDKADYYIEDMGVEPYLVASSLVGIIAQRLVRKVCPFCGEWRICHHGIKLTVSKFIFF